MKRTCNNCRAYEIEGKCNLGIKISTTHVWSGPNGSMYDGTPLEECEKPLTNKHFVRLLLAD